MLSMVVVLPAPLRPTRHTDSASPTLSDRSWSTWAGPRKVLSALDVEHGSAGPGCPACWRYLRVAPDLLRGAVGQDRALVHGHDARAVA